MTELTKRKFTEKEELFLDYLFSDDCKGDVRSAMTLAGYAKTSNKHDLINRLKDEIIDRTNTYMATIGPNAAMALFDVLQQPAALGSSVKLNAAKEILDRIGVVKKEEKTVDITVRNVVELPMKNAPVTIEGEIVQE